MLFFCPTLQHKNRRSHLVKGRSPETNLWLDDSMLTYTRLLAKHCTDECFSYKLTHFELHLFIATMRWNILFILEKGDQPVDNDMPSEAAKQLILWFTFHLADAVTQKMMMSACVGERERSEREWGVLNSSLLSSIMPLQCSTQRSHLLSF